ncbi:Transcription factor SPT8 [Cyberlindnera fabianii]|uniref:Transcription factor SPT8 n=1 Tax=Cyberlindnera fabianii TaxID=36022 RepID=A0A1V2L0T2_CYBFA|nr:Transcription factor SPT8 [Cyberlindnera fabianii]
MKAKIADNYDVSPIVAIPYASQINTVALSRSSKWLFTGGDDGFIRRYDFFGSIDGEVQLTAAQKHSLVDLISNGGALCGYWENELPVKRSTIKTDSYEPKLSPVYSLAVEMNCLWLLSGLSNGGINLQSVRHNEGTILHHFKKHTDTVSVLQLNERQDAFLSGSWDKMIHMWDLNTGKTTRSFTESTGQITSIQYRPTGGIDIDSIKLQAPSGDDDDLDSLFGSDDAAAAGTSTAAVATSDDGTGNDGNNNNGTTIKPIDENIFMSAAIDGSLYVWDVRAEHAALKIRAPKGTPPWCMSACWSASGDSIFVGRRNSTVEEFSLKMPIFSNGDARPAKVLKFPQVSGPVTAVRALPNHDHVICGSYDNIRIYDLRLYSEAHKRTPFLIVPGHHGGTISQLEFDPTYRYMMSASGNRGWEGTSTETVFIYNVNSL